MPKHSITHVLGSGQLWFGLEDSDGNPQGLRYLGDTPGFTLQIQTEQIDTWSSDGPTAEREDLAVTQVTRSTQITCKEMSPENWGLFLIADVDELAETADSVTDEEHDVKPGHAYHLGVTDENPVGARNVENVEVSDGDTTTYDEGDDYELDADLGRIYIMPDGDIDESTIHVDYDTTASTRDLITAADLAEQYGELRYYADNTRGPNRNLYVPRLILRPDGETQLKSREQYQQMQFQAEFLKREGKAQAYIDGVPVADG
ncbi:MAG: hypothetical protein ACOCUS_03740 [Polyangiales bacterium]